MRLNYVLVAEGSINLPQINHSLMNADDPGTAKQELERIMQTLSGVGYTRFTMHDVRDDEPHQIIAGYLVETVKPIVHTSFKG